LDGIPTSGVPAARREIASDRARVLWVLMGTIAMVLLIACANVANLFSVRADSRQQELAVRAALGASRGRIARALLSESVTLGLAGGVVGVALVFAGCSVLRSDAVLIGKGASGPGVLSLTWTATGAVSRKQ
jgi:ABC-type antimicrobial peptide transport system permease subunit